MLEGRGKEGRWGSGFGRTYDGRDYHRGNGDGYTGCGGDDDPRGSD